MLRMLDALAPTVLTLLVCLAWCARPGHAATWHVSPAGAAGNPGSAEQPLPTIAAALALASPDDTVRIHAGTYSETVVVPASGEPDRPIVLEGERGPNGQWLTVLDLGQPVGGWEPAPEVGPGVFKADLGFAPYSMTLDGQQLARVFDGLMDTGRGFELLALPADAPVDEGNSYYTADQQFWGGIEVLYGVREGITYIRLRNGDDPTGLNLRSAPAGGGIELRGISHVTIRGLRITNAQDCVVIDGPDAQHNVVEECFLTNGHNRVVISGGASYNVVRNNEMTLNYYGYADPGAWGTLTPNARTSTRARLYQVFKYLQGPNASDDHGVLLRGGGIGNEVSGNHIYAGLIGVSVGASRDTDVHHNIIHGMSSIGILTSEDAGKGAVDGRFHDNLVYDCNINLRLHHYNNCLPGERREFHYRNLSWEPPGLGSHIYVHWTSTEIPEGRDHPEMYLYHNTFAGGQRAFSVSAWADNAGGLRGMWLLNNVFAASVSLYATSIFQADAQMMGPVDHNLIAGAINHGGAAWVGPHNVILADGAALWPFEAMPDFALASDSPARAIGLDLSRRFEVMGRTHEALPGMAPGYFAGAAPDTGALQFGEEPPVALPGR